MTNEEKSIDLAENISPYDIGGDNDAHYAAKEAALDMAEWKDEQFKTERQNLINKACEYLRNNIDSGLTIYHNDTWMKLGEFIRDFRKAMDETI